MARRWPRHSCAFLLLAGILSCGAPAMPTMPSAPAANPTMTGTWSGTSVDSQGTTVVTWTITQVGQAVTGEVATRAPDPNDGSCNACHRNKRGTFTGSISDSVLTLNLQFAAGVDGDPTPICSSTMSGSAPGGIVGQLIGTYTGADTCEGAFLNGRFTMTRQ